MANVDGARMEIESETRFLWRMLLDTILTPIVLVQVLFRQKQPGELFKPWKDLFVFLFEPRFTVGMIIATVAASIYFWSMQHGLQDSLITYPQDLLDPSRLYSLFTSGFVHMDIKHLLGNMLALYIFGRVVEKRHGAGKTALIYFGALIMSGVGDSTVSLIFGETRGALGASGAVMGLVAAAMLSDPFYFTYMLVIPMPVMVAAWLYIYTDITGILTSVDDGIGHFAHMFGFLSVTITLFLVGEKAELKRGLVINLASLAMGALLYFLMLSGYIPNPFAILKNMI
jgi:membrane associated rhomboid family serine protease